MQRTSALLAILVSFGAVLAVCGGGHSSRERTAVRAGVKMAFGTDAGAMQAIQAATVNAADLIATANCSGR